MANHEKLYRKLHEEFGLEFNEDFWRHKQSGKYIITHNAVKKIVAQQRKKGFIIQTPKTKEIDTIIGVGPDGAEVVKSADFYLLDSEGNVLRHEAAIGEANEKNCRLAFRHTMANKRMFDRGCLSLLQIAELGGYSDSEADDFSKSANRTSTKAETQAAPHPAPPQAAARVPQPRAPQPPAPVSEPVPRQPAPQAPPKKVEAQGDDELIRFITSNDIVSKGDICNHMGWEPASFLSRINPLVESGALIRTGQKRGTKYSVPKGGASRPAPPAPVSSPLTHQEYHVMWRDASERLRSLGMSQLVIGRLVREATGHETAIAAHQNGSLTKESVDKIFALGQRWSASANQGGGTTHGL